MKKIENSFIDITTPHIFLKDRIKKNHLTLLYEDLDEK